MGQVYKVTVEVGAVTRLSKGTVMNVLLCVSIVWYPDRPLGSVRKWNL